MDNQRRDEYKKKLFDSTPPDGKFISNASLRESLKKAFPNEEFTQDDYWDLRRSLIIEGKLERGRGQGGSVRRVLTVAPALPVGNAAPIAGGGAAEAIGIVVAQGPVAAPVLTEASLYGPFQNVIQTGYVPDNDLDPWICEITAAQGRRNTGGFGRDRTSH